MREVCRNSKKYLKFEHALELALKKHISPVSLAHIEKHESTDSCLVNHRQNIQKQPMNVFGF